MKDTVLDEFTREALCVRVAKKMGSHEVVEALTPLIGQRGAPDHLRSDNGPEFIAEPLRTWLKRDGIDPIRSLPGSPWENGYNQRVNWALLQEVLNAERFAPTRYASTVINTLLSQYNQIRPHGALGMQPPTPETI